MTMSVTNLDIPLMLSTHSSAFPAVPIGPTNVTSSASSNRNVEKSCDFHDSKYFVATVRASICISSRIHELIQANASMPSNSRADRTCSIRDGSFLRHCLAQFCAVQESMRIVTL